MEGELERHARDIMGTVRGIGPDSVRIVTTEDLAIPCVFILWEGDIVFAYQQSKFHGVYTTKQGAMAAAPKIHPLWVPSTQYPHDAWIQDGTAWYVMRHQLDVGQ